jgi:hypothetical protein
MAICVDIVQGMGRQAFVSQIFIGCTTVAPMAINADVFAGMDDVPASLFIYRVFLGMAGGA